MDTSAPAVRQDNRPTPDEWRAFGARLLHAAGTGSLGAGVIFFVAANWQAWGLVGRFGLLEAGLLLCIVAALWRPPPARGGQAALLLATLFAGALLALFGQSYQTGADVYELFFNWALLTLPFAVVALSGAVWAVWWVVLDVGLALLCGGLAPDRFFWLIFADRDRDRSMLLMLPCLANLFAATAFLMIRRSRFKEAAPVWLAPWLLTIGLGFGTAAALPQMTNHGSPVIASYAVISLGIAVMTLRRRHDVFPLTALAGSWIAISTLWLVQSLQFDKLGAFFIIAVWLIGSSTAAAMLLIRCLHRWRTTTVEGVAR